VGSFTKFERAMLRERTRSGLLAAREEGRIDGRPPSSRQRNKRKLCTWLILARKRPPNPRGCSMSIRPQWRDSWPATNSQIS
jgi:hypothetical protein